MRNLTAEEWMIVSGGHPSEQPNGEMQEVVVNGERHNFRDPFSGVPYWMNATYWAHMPYGMRPMGYHDDQGGGGGPDSTDDETQQSQEVVITAPSFEHAQYNQAGWAKAVEFFIGLIGGFILKEVWTKIKGLANVREETGTMDENNWARDQNGELKKGVTYNALGDKYEIRYSTNGSFWVDLDRDGKFESNFRINVITGFLEVNEDNRGNFWTPCLRADWLRCTDGSGG
jgi:hypothetical protein